MLVLGATTLISARYRIGPIGLLVLLAVGIELRYAQFGVGWSDVPTAIRRQCDDVPAGINPYSPDLPSTGRRSRTGRWRCSGTCRCNDPRLQEFGISVLLLSLGVLTLRGEPMGLALWARCRLRSSCRE